MPADTYTETKATAPPKRRRTFVATIRVGGEARIGPRPERERRGIGFSMSACCGLGDAEVVARSWSRGEHREEWAHWTVRGWARCEVRNAG